MPREPRTTFNVGRVGGGTSVNSIASSTPGWKSTCGPRIRAALRALDAGFQKAVDAALADENARWDNRGRLTVEKALVGNRPGGRNSADAPILERCGVGDSARLGGGPGSTRARPTPIFR